VIASRLQLKWLLEPEASNNLLTGRRGTSGNPKAFLDSGYPPPADSGMTRFEIPFTVLNV